MTDPHIELLPAIPADLEAIDVMPDGAWVGAGGLPAARDVWFGGHVVRTSVACTYPLVCALDHETAVLVDARARGDRPNAWVIGADGRVSAEFAVGDAVESLASLRGQLVVSHFDEGFGSRLHGMLIFDRYGALQFDYPAT